MVKSPRQKWAYTRTDGMLSSNEIRSQEGENKMEERIRKKEREEKRELIIQARRINFPVQIIVFESC